MSKLEWILYGLSLALMGHAVFYAFTGLHFWAPAEAGSLRAFFLVLIHVAALFGSIIGSAKLADD